MTSVQDQLQNFYNTLNQTYFQVADQKTYKLTSNESDWTNVIILNDFNEDLKPWLKFLAKNTNGNQTEYFFIYSMDQGIQNGIQKLLGTQYINKSVSSLVSIVTL